jgi:hypothetical protein
MALRLKTVVSFNEAALKKMLGVPKVLASDVIPAALKSVEPAIRESFMKHLPDSDKAEFSSRLKQSRKARARWPNKLNQQLSSKVKQDDRGVLMISGVRIPQGQYVYIDMHDKAKTVGRKHVLWGKKVKGLRRMPIDVPKIVRFENAKRIYQAIYDAIRSAAAAGRFE